MTTTILAWALLNVSLFFTARVYTSTIIRFCQFAMWLFHGNNNKRHVLLF